jgi:hypothetical protein
MTTLDPAMKCTHPGHVEGRRCIDHAFSCHPRCFCCNGPADLEPGSEQLVLWNCHGCGARHLVRAMTPECPLCGCCQPAWYEIPPRLLEDLGIDSMATRAIKALERALHMDMVDSRATPFVDYDDEGRQILIDGGKALDMLVRKARAERAERYEETTP